MIVRSLALGAAASLSCAFGANAADWSGYYIGLNAGQGWSESDTTRTITNNAYFAPANLTSVQASSAMLLEEETFAGGAQVGVNWPLSEHLLLGAEFDALGYGNDTSAAANNVPYPTGVGINYSVSNSVEQTWLASARLRIGFTAGWFMAYATGGYAGGETKFAQTFSDNAGPIALQTVENSEFRSGHSIGAGIEVMIESGASLKFEYLRYDLGEISAVGPMALGGTTSNGVADVSNDVWRVGFNFQID